MYQYLGKVDKNIIREHFSLKFLSPWREKFFNDYKPWTYSDSITRRISYVHKKPLESCQEEATQRKLNKLKRLTNQPTLR